MPRLYDFPDSYFETRLNDLGFTNQSCVFDIACGAGEWTRHLAAHNARVIGFDIDQNALRDARNSLNAADFVFGNMLKLPIKDAAADAVFCFDSLMFANPSRVLHEFNRVLRSGGRAYASINGMGWALNCIFHRGLKKRNFAKINMGLRMFSDTAIRRVLVPEHPVENTFFTQKDLARLAEACGFEVLHIGYESSFKNPGFERYQPCFPSTYLGASCSLEILMRKL